LAPAKQNLAVVIAQIMFRGRDGPQSIAYAEVFDLKEFVAAVFRTFAADAAAERLDLGRDVPPLMPTMPYSRVSATR
jgi:hypothetical protein